MLANLIMEWKQWSKEADKMENGWEADFPKWGSLISLASSLLKQNSLTASELLALATAFELSDECELLLEFSKKNFLLCKANLILLAKSENPNTRWQVYEVFRVGDHETDAVLLDALITEKSLYPLRRAILSLCDRDVPDKEKISQKSERHSDEYVRKAARTLKESKIF